MKVYISVDIEGITGVTGWDETDLGSGTHPAAVEQMRLEALAACQGVLDAGADEIWVKDAHESGRNLPVTGFPREVRLIRSWTGSPDSMVAGVDESFDAALCIGYHSEGGSGSSPLAHTMDREKLFWVKLDGELMSELEYHTWVCAKYGVPMVLVSGDRGICEKAERVLPGIQTVVTKEGVGSATVNRSPEVVCEEIRTAARDAVSNLGRVRVRADREMTLEVCFRRHEDALRASFYPGAEQTDAHTVRYRAANIEDMQRAFLFVR